MDMHHRSVPSGSAAFFGIMDQQPEYIPSSPPHPSRGKQHTGVKASSEDHYDMQEEMTPSTAQSGIMLVKNNQIILANYSCAALLGYAPQELMDEDIQNILFPLDGAPITEKIDQAVRNHAKSIHVRAIGIKKTKSILYLNLVCGLSVIDHEPNLIINLLDVTAQTLSKARGEF